jgi:hypothetical protein
MLTNKNLHSGLWTHTYKPYLYELLQETEAAELEIDEDTTDSSFSTETLSLSDTKASCHGGSR